MEPSPATKEDGMLLKSRATRKARPTAAIRAAYRDAKRGPAAVLWRGPFSLGDTCGNMQSSADALRAPRDNSPRGTRCRFGSTRFA